MKSITFFPKKMFLSLIIPIIGLLLSLGQKNSQAREYHPDDILWICHELGGIYWDDMGNPPLDYGCLLPDGRKIHCAKSLGCILISKKSPASPSTPLGLSPEDRMLKKEFKVRTVMSERDFQRHYPRRYRPRPATFSDAQKRKYQRKVKEFGLAP